MKLKINTEACVGCGVCASSFPEAFELGDDGFATVIGELTEADAEDAIGQCPGGAIEKE